MLDGWVDKFRAASYKFRERIVLDFYNSFKSTCPKGIKFDELAIETVRTPSAALGFSHTFLAYSPAHVWESQTGNKEIGSPGPKLDG
jgi:hypothetical protein